MNVSSLLLEQWGSDSPPIIIKPVGMAWMHKVKYKGINRWTLRIVCLSFVPKVRQCSAYCCYHCDSLLMVQDLSKQQKLHPKKLGWSNRYLYIYHSGLTTSVVALWGQLSRVSFPRPSNVHETGFPHDVAISFEWHRSLRLSASLLCKHCS